MRGLRAWNLAITLAYLLIAIGIMIYSSEQSLRGRLFPWGAGIAIIIVAVPLLVWEWRRRHLPATRSGYDAVDQLSGKEVTGVLGVLGWILGLFAAIYVIGIEIAIPMFTFLYMVAHRERLILAAGISVACALFIYLVMYEALSIRFFDPLIGNFF